MARSQRSVVEYVCDRCGFELSGEDIAADEARNCGPSSREFHVLVLPVPDRNSQKLCDPHAPRAWLCANCTAGHGAFMRGELG